MNQSQCSKEEFLQAIHELLGKKELTYAVISRRLSLAVEHELLRPRGEIRETFIRACLGLQRIVEDAEAFVGDRDYGRLRLEAAMTRHRRQHKR